MTELIPINNTEVVFELNDGKVFTDSLCIAAAFNKDHHNVIKAIRKMPSDKFAQVNFNAGSYLDANNQKRSMYNITRDGFSMLVMGFTGKDAYKWKVQFIEAFNLMESKLRGTATPTLPAAEERITYFVENRFNAIAEELRNIKDQVLEDAKERQEVRVLLQQSSIATKNLAHVLENLPLETTQLAFIRQSVEDKGRELAEARALRSEVVIPAIFREINRFYDVKSYSYLSRDDYRSVLHTIRTFTI